MTADEFQVIADLAHRPPHGSLTPEGVRVTRVPEKACPDCEPLVNYWRRRYDRLYQQNLLLQARAEEWRRALEDYTDQHAPVICGFVPWEEDQ